MKKVIVVSDNHFAKEGIEFIKKEYKDIDYFLHCGDSDMYSDDLVGWNVVSGNHDQFFSPFPQELILEIEEHRFLIVHGHKHGIFLGYYDTLVEDAKNKKCDVVCFGHIHWYVDGERKGIRLLNPGSIRYPRDGADMSYMYLEVTKDKIKAERKIFMGDIY